jgi:photosystem II stability/assembly factor-like uncharacterized protein
MKGDFTRFTFRPEKHYRSVRVQQGRVQLDADWNEQADIATHRDDIAAADLIGRQGAPWHGGGFQLVWRMIPHTLYAISFPTGTLGFAVGADGMILSVTTSTPWTRQASTTTLPLRGVCAVPSGAGAIGLAVGEAGTILYTSNAGATWTAQSSPAAATLHAVSTLDGVRAIAVGDAGTILQTKNSPTETWSAIGPTAVAVNLRAVQMIQVGTATHVFVVGDGGLFLHGSFQHPGDDVTWDQPVLAPSSSANLRLNDVNFVDDKVGVVVGELGTILKTGDRGASWAAAQVAGGSPTSDLRGVRLSKDATTQVITGVIVGDDGTVLQTGDGTTWSLQTSNVSMDLRGVTVVGPSWLAVGDESTILGRSGSNLIGVAGGPPNEWALSPGHLYVDGILCENEGYTGLRSQPDGGAVTLDMNQLIYLDVWERHLTATDLPELREVALGGPDTTTRVRTVWQVRTMQAPEGGACPLDGPWVPAGVNPTTGQLAARAAPVPPVTDICIVPPSGGYRRLENQLYRIEIHDPGDAGVATFTWSRDNASRVARVDRIAGTAIRVTNGGSPETLAGFAGASVVEVIDDPMILGGKPGVVVAVGAIEDSTLTVADADKNKVLPQGAGRIVRRWESKPINLQPGQWIHLGVDRGGGQIDEEGVQVRFEAGTYNTGDYWVIPARTLSGSIEWPSDDGEALFKPPDGVLHHYCPLAITDTVSPVAIKSDCRRLFPSLPDLSTLYYAGGDGQEYGPELVSANLPLRVPLQVAVPALPAMVRFTPLRGTIRRTANPGDGGPSATPGGPLTWLDVGVGNDGIASCYWWLDTSVGAPESQQVRAVLLDIIGTKRGRPMWFSATLSQAKDVFYDPASCQALTGITNVQSAIDAVLGLRTIRYVSGDGQHALPYRPLPEPLQVGVASTCGPVGARVRFTADGSGQLASVFQQLGGTTTGTNPLEVDAGSDGIAACYWLPDPRSKKAGQHVQAQLIGSGQPTGIPVIFTTSLSPGLHITKVGIPAGHSLFDNDVVIAPAELAEGVVVDIDGPIDESAIRPPIMTITLDLPFPVVPLDRDFFGIGPSPAPTPLFSPMVMAGQVTATSTGIRWVPVNNIVNWTGRLLDMGGRLGFARVLARLVIYGNSIWSSDGRLNLDGDVFLGLDKRPLPLLHLPSGDGQLGGNFEMWFWIGK